MTGPRWYAPGITQLNQLRADSITIPTSGGNAEGVVLKKAGFVRKIRGYLSAKVSQSAGTGAPSKSAYGALGGSLKRIQVLVAGRKPFFTLSGLGLAYYNEIANPDASILAPPAFLAGANEVVIAEGKHLTEHTAGTTGAVTYTLRQPFELPFSLPVWFTNMVRSGKLDAGAMFPTMIEEEVGLWYLQERKSEVSIESEWFAAFTTTGPKAPYNAGTGVAATWDQANSQVQLERELFDVPGGPPELVYPNQTYVHQVVERQATISGKAFSFPIPQIGGLLRVGMIVLDSNDALVEWDDVTEIAWSFGVNDRPIVRSGAFYTEEYLQDYDRYPPKGMLVLDFWKAGRYAAKLARNTDTIANLELTGELSATTTGKVLFLLESLVPNRTEAPAG